MPEAVLGFPKRKTLKTKTNPLNLKHSFSVAVATKIIKLKLRKKWFGSSLKGEENKTPKRNHQPL
jgi:hypothetical protein